MDFNAAALQVVLSTLEANTPETQYAVALSGGADSLALLSALSECVSPDRILALHFNHQIHPDSAAWSRLCETVSEERDIVFQTAVWNNKTISGKPREVDARIARYRWFGQKLPETHVLLTGHHLDDQAETVLMNLAEGRSLERVAGIPAIRSLGFGDKRTIIRPLLGFRHTDLCRYLQERGIRWIEDPANADAQHSRSLLRHQILPVLSERWPGVAPSIGRVAKELTETLGIIEEISEAVIADTKRPEKQTLLCKTVPLFLDPLLMISAPRFNAVMRRWTHSGKSTSPTNKQLQELYRQLPHATSESHCQIDCGTGEVIYFNRHLFLIEKSQFSSAFEMVCVPGSYSLSPRLSVKFEASESGLDKMLLQSEALKWQMRQGQHRFTFSRNGGSVSLKKAMQAKKVAPWLRESLPVLTSGQDVVWAQGIGVNARYQVSESGRAGILPILSVIY